jgi:hypothetical protein
MIRLIRRIYEAIYWAITYLAAAADLREVARGEEAGS